MSVCKWCRRSGWFLSVTSDGLCKKCEPAVVLAVQSRHRIINDSTKIIDESKNVSTRVKRCDLVLDLLGELVKYEERGIPTIQPPPGAFIRKVQVTRDEVISEGLESEVEKAKAKADLASGTKSKIGHLSKALLKIQEYEGQIGTPKLLDDLRKSVALLIHQTQLNGFLDEARKAEFKGQRKKALDQFQEALYFLKTDDIDDSLQGAHIAEIEAKIAELGGEN